MTKIVLLCLLVSGISFGQKIDVAELQIKLKAGASEELLYGFAAGDRILCTIEEANGNTIHEVIIAEFPGTIKYKGIDVKKEKNREIAVNTKAVYKFTLANNTKEERLCNVRIQRIPANLENRNFNTAVKFITRQDTTYNFLTTDVVVGYDTVYAQKTRRVVDSKKQYEELVLDKNQRVDPKGTTFGANRTSIAFALPAGSVGKDETKQVVAWAYWVGVGEESNEFWKQNRKMIVGAVQGATTIFTSPLGGIAAGAVTNLMLPTNGEDVAYALASEQNARLFMADKAYKYFDTGKGVAAYKRITDAGLMKGKYCVLLENDNYVQPVDVNVKVSAIIEHIKYRNETFTEKVISPRYGKKILREPQINTAKVPVTFDTK